MMSFLIARIAQMGVVLFGILTLLFFLLRLTGDPLSMLAAPDTPPQQLDHLRHSMGLDQPPVQQYVIFLRHSLVLDFGNSIQYGQPALPLVLARLPATIELTVAAFILAIVVGLPLGVIAAIERRRTVSMLVGMAAGLGQSMPLFWLGLLLILLFGVRLQLLPTFGIGGPDHLILPALTLGAPTLAKTMRLIRSSMLEVLGQDYVRTAKAKGLSRRVVIVRHALRNALIPTVTALGVDFGLLLGGAVLVEQVFAWPGMGRQLTQAVLGRDYPLIEATVFVIGTLILVINLAVDLSYRYLDPRIRLEVS